MAQINALGATLVTISPQIAQFNREFAQQKQYTFDLLSDPGNKVAAKYGLVYTVAEEVRKVYLQFGLDVPRHNGDDSWTLPMPARYIIDRGGVIRYAQVEPDHSIRPEPEHTIAALKQLPA